MRDSWAIPAACIVAVEYAIALVVGFSIGFRYSIPFSTYLVIGLLAGGAAICGVCAYRIIRPRGAAADLLDIALAVLLVSLQMAVLGWLKIMLPHAQMFWADPLFADMDAALFGTDPWKLSHFLFGWATPLIDRAYVSWTLVKPAVLLAVAIAPPSALRNRALTSYFVLVSTVALSQYALSSAGPVFYQRFGFGDRFTDLPVQPWVAAGVAYLWDGYHQTTANLGGGISAMPSLHVAFALWLVFVVRGYFPRLRAIGWAYFTLILIGSVHLGWHYAVDGIAAVLIGLASWMVANPKSFPSINRDATPEGVRL